MTPLLDQVARARPWRSSAPAARSTPLVHIDARGLFVTTDGALWSWLGITAFLLLRTFLEGDRTAVRSFFLWMVTYGFNVARVFSQVNWINNDPGPALRPAQYPQYDQHLGEFLDEAHARGIYIELVGHTFADDLERMVDHLVRLDRVCTGRPNVFLEYANEPQRNAIDIDALAARFPHPAYPWATGQYRPVARPVGSYVTDHSPRDDQWPRKAKDAYEFFHGGGPESSSDPALRRPIVEDEPMGAGERDPDDPTRAHRAYTSQRAVEPDDFYTYAALAQLMGAGATFHYQDGLRALIPTGNQLACAVAFALGAEAIPGDARLGNYDRVDEQGATLRSYIRGRWMVRVRPTTPTPPAGWRATDAAGIVCTR